MHIHFHHHHYYDNEIIKRLELIMSLLDDLQTSVANENTVIDSAITLLQGLSEALKTAGTDPQKLAELKSSIDTKTQALAAAIIANTPTPNPAP